MTTNEMISRMYSAWAEETKGFMKTGTLTGGSETTFVDSSLSQADDFFNEMEIEILSGSAAGERREIVDWVKSSTTGTVDKAFSASLASGNKYRIGHKGFWSVNECLEYLTDAANELKNLLLDDAYFRNFGYSTIGGSSVSGKEYAESEMPTDVVRPIAIFINGVKARIYQTDEARGFYRDPYIDAGVLLGGVDRQTAGKSVHYKPKTSTSLMWVYIKETSVTLDDPSDAPSNLHPIIVNKAIASGFMKLQRTDLAKAYEGEVASQVQAINLQTIQNLGATAK